MVRREDLKKKVPDEVASAAAKAIRRVGIKNVEYTPVWQNEVFIDRTNTGPVRIIEHL